MHCREPVPPWVRDVDRVLSAALRDTALLASATPEGGLTRAELVRAFESGAPRALAGPTPCSAPRAPSPPRRRSSARRAARSAGPSGAESYAGRAAQLAWSLSPLPVGTAGSPRRRACRFPPKSPRGLRRVARAGGSPSRRSRTSSTTTDRAIRSRSCRVSAGRQRVPFRVVVAQGLAPLAATGTAPSGSRQAARCRASTWSGPFFTRSRGTCSPAPERARSSWGSSRWGRRAGRTTRRVLRSCSRGPRVPVRRAHARARAEASRDRGDGRGGDVRGCGADARRARRGDDRARGGGRGARVPGERGGDGGARAGAGVRGGVREGEKERLEGKPERRG